MGARCVGVRGGGVSLAYIPASADHCPRPRQYTESPPRFPPPASPSVAGGWGWGTRVPLPPPRPRVRRPGSRVVGVAVGPVPRRLPRARPRRRLLALGRGWADHRPPLAACGGGETAREGWRWSGPWWAPWRCSRCCWRPRPGSRRQRRRTTTPSRTPSRSPPSNCGSRNSSSRRPTLRSACCRCRWRVPRPGRRRQRLRPLLPRERGSHRRPAALPPQLGPRRPPRAEDHPAAGVRRRLHVIRLGEVLRRRPRVAEPDAPRPRLARRRQERDAVEAAPLLGDRGDEALPVRLGRGDDQELGTEDRVAVRLGEGDRVGDILARPIRHGGHPRSGTMAAT